MSWVTKRIVTDAVDRGRVEQRRLDAGDPVDRVQQDGEDAHHRDQDPRVAQYDIVREVVNKDVGEL